jgi:2-polyprenyl-6-methoxyphenol hydroxylase-like FAD-dependent oxidoreductase
MLTTDILIVGAGPVGLFLGCRLAQLGISFKIVEKRTSRFQHSRSIGIHPTLLEKLAPLGVVDEILQRGTHISKGHGFINTKYIGALNFSKCPKPYNFVVTLPQFETEAILEKRLCELAPASVLRGYEVVGLEQTDELVNVKIENSHTTFQQGDLSHCQERVKTISAKELHNQPSTFNLAGITAKFVIACDGKDSLVRQLANIPFHGRDYPDTYVMGDFADNTKFGSDAAIYLTNEGLIESFPLAKGVRRWVAKTNKRVTEPSVELLGQLVKTRVNHELPLETNSMLSSFGVQRYLADVFVKNRVILAGDAAHVLSPIGGQGMNLGWLDAWDVAETLESILLKNQSVTEQLKRYDLSRQRSARAAIRRAEFNMRMGRSTRFGFAKHALAKVLLQEPFATGLSKMFTMRGL